jgi:archaeosine synthase beta-subunit
MAEPRLERDLVRRMRRVARRYREMHPLSSPTWSAGSYPLTGTFGGRTNAKALAWFPSSGCAWSLKGGCTMCDFGSTGAPTSVEAALRAFDEHLATLDPGLRRLHVAPGGSFFSSVEVPEALRLGVLGKLARFPFLSAVGIETRPNLLTCENLLQAVEGLPPTVRNLTVGFGFECRNDLVRELAVNKGYGAKHVLRGRDAIAAVNRAQSRVHVNFEIYVLLKPLFLTEAEAIEEAISTIQWSYAVGAGAVVLFLNTVKPRTLQGYLAARTDLAAPLHYTTPYYRSAIEVMRRLDADERRRTIMLGVQSGVLAEGMPRGCPLCTPFLLGAIMAFNFTLARAPLDEAATSSCACREAWEEELLAPCAPLVERIDDGIAALEAAFAIRS